MLRPEELEEGDKPMTNVHVVPLVAVSAQHLPILKPPIGKVTEGPGLAFKAIEAIRI